MEKQDVIAFFDRYAPTWDANMVKNDEIINIILDNAEVGAGMDILDVACGTGVMIPYYLQRGAASVTGIDISTAHCFKVCTAFVKEFIYKLISIADNADSTYSIQTEL